MLYLHYNSFFSISDVNLFLLVRIVPRYVKYFTVSKLCVPKVLHINFHGKVFVMQS